MPYSARMANEPTQQTAPAILRQLVVDLGMTQAAFARAIGVKPQQLQEWLTARRPVPPHRAIMIERLTAGSVRAERLSFGFDFERDASGAAVAYRVRVDAAQPEEFADAAPPTTNAEAA